MSIEKAIELLEKYGRHLASCVYIQYSYNTKFPCTCGFDQALAELTKANEDIERLKAIVKTVKDNIEFYGKCSKRSDEIDQALKDATDGEV